MRTTISSLLPFAVFPLPFFGQCNSTSGSGVEVRLAYDV